MRGAIRERLLELFGHGVDAPVADDEFNALALEVFRNQVDANPAYAAYCSARVGKLDHITDWTAVPAVPTQAFKLAGLHVGGSGAPEAVFRTSGTTGGPDRRGTHPVADLELYRASLLPNFVANVLPDGRSVPMVCLAPSPEDAPDSSLSHMLGVVADEVTTCDGFFVDADRGLDVHGLEVVVRSHAESDQPVLLAGTAFAFVHWLDALSARGTALDLPEGSRVMETGGFKGRSREVARPDLYAAIERLLGVPDERIVNEYGMTELLSQYYEPVLRGRPRRHVAPPWLRPRILDPETLQEASMGDVGLIQHFDLANLDSISAVLTEDLGRLSAHGLELLGRASDAESRGCSIAMDALLSATSQTSA